MGREKFITTDKLIVASTSFHTVDTHQIIIAVDITSLLCILSYITLPSSISQLINESVGGSTCGASMEQILANRTCPERANRMCSLNVENHIIHSKSAVSCNSISKRTEIRQTYAPTTFVFCIFAELWMLSHHSSPKVVPSWLHAGFECLSVCIGWNKKE